MPRITLLWFAVYYLVQGGYRFYFKPVKTQNVSTQIKAVLCCLFGCTRWLQVLSPWMKLSKCHHSDNSSVLSSSFLLCSCSTFAQYVVQGESLKVKLPLKATFRDETTKKLRKLRTNLACTCKLNLSAGFLKFTIFQLNWKPRNMISYCND